MNQNQFHGSEHGLTGEQSPYIDPHAIVWHIRRYPLGQYLRASMQRLKKKSISGVGEVMNASEHTIARPVQNTG